MRVAGVLMMAIGLLLVVAPMIVVLLLGWTVFLAQGAVMVALYGLLVLMGVGLILVGRRAGFPKD